MSEENDGKGSRHPKPYGFGCLLCVKSPCFVSLLFKIWWPTSAPLVRQFSDVSLPARAEQTHPCRRRHRIAAGEQLDAVHQLQKALFGQMINRLCQDVGNQNANAGDIYPVFVLVLHRVHLSETDFQ